MKLGTVLAVTLAVLMTGCGLSPVSTVTSNQEEMDALAKTDFSRLVINRASLMRDGGSIIISGYVNRSIYTDFRVDNSISTEVKGKIYVVVYEGMKGPGSAKERLVKKSEVAAILKAAESNKTRTGSDLNLTALERFIASLEAFAAK